MSLHEKRDRLLYWLQHSLYPNHILALPEVVEFLSTQYDDDRAGGPLKRQTSLFLKQFGTALRSALGRPRVQAQGRPASTILGWLEPDVAIRYALQWELLRRRDKLSADGALRQLIGCMRIERQYKYTTQFELLDDSDVDEGRFFSTLEVIDKPLLFKESAEHPRLEFDIAHGRLLIAWWRTLKSCAFKRYPQTEFDFDHFLATAPSTPACIGVLFTKEPNFSFQRPSSPVLLGSIDTD